MSYVESTTAQPNPLRQSALGSGLVDPETDEAEKDEDEEAQPEHQARDRKGETALEKLINQVDDINLARYLPDDRLREIGMTVCQEFEIDENSRANWKDITVKAMRFALQDPEAKEFPWPGASNVIYPLIPQATIEFASRTYPALIQGRKVVKGVVYGSDKGTPVMQDGRPKMAPPPPGAPPGTPPQPVWLIAPGEKKQRAERIGTHMSWQVLEQMPEWEPQTDSMLHQIPITGGMVRKTFRDVVEKRNSSLTISLMNLVWNYDAPSFEKAPRHTEIQMLYPYEIEDAEREGADDDEMGEGMFLKLNYAAGDASSGDGTKYGFQGLTDTESSGFDADPDAPHMFLLQDRRLDLDGDGYAEPYTVTVHKRSQRVVRITARYDETGVKASKGGKEILKVIPLEQYTLIPFFPSLDGGSYPIGWGHLLHGLNDQINSTLNQMFDAGTLQNAGGGFIGDNMNMASGQTLFRVGKFIRVNTKGGTIRDAIYMPDWKGPSPTLFQLLGFLTEAAKSLASLQNVLAGDASVANAPPTTILALIEQGLKTYTAIHKRIYRAFKKEFEKLAYLNGRYMTEPETFRVGDDEHEIDKSDYLIGTGVAPVADPSMITDMQKLARSQILQAFKGDPDINQREIKQRLFEAADMDRVEDLFAPPDPQLQAMAQMEMAHKQAELGRIRAAEQKDNTQAFLNLALARKNASAQEETFIEAQLDFLRLHIEAINASVRAAAVDHKFHESSMRQLAEHARHLATEQPISPATDAAAAVAPTPGPTGPFPVPPSAPAGPVAGGVGTMAQPAGNAGLPAVPGGPGPGVAGPGG